MPPDLPPLTALRAFEAAARRASFKAAAAELFVTPTAVSHQVRQLEEWLGVRVLDRSPRSVSLTPEGRGLYDAAAAGFAEIGRASARLRAPRALAALTLSSTAAFLGHWLVPRLAELRRLAPALELRLHASDAPVGLCVGEVDLAVRYGEGPFPGVESTPLVADAFAPVCSPRLNVRTFADLRRATLLHVDGRVRPRPRPTWSRWCAEAGVAGVDTAAGVRLPDSMLAVQAAIAGQGVVLVSQVLVADALASGLLVRPFARSLPGDTYHFVCAPGLGARADVAALRAWFVRTLVASTGRSGAASRTR